MGYIFDALNKNNSEEPEDLTPEPETSDSPSLDEPTPQTPQDDSGYLAEPIAQAEQEQPAEDIAPLRLADVQLAIDTDEQGQTIVDAQEQPEPVIELHAQHPIPQAFDQPQEQAPQTVEFDDQPLADADEATADFSMDEQPLQLVQPKPAKTGWWNRLMGRHFRGKVDDRLVAMTSPASAMSEEYRSIRTSILARHDNERHLVHTITSATPQEGKTITCVNLGLAFAELRNRKTVIVECDLRLPTFGKLLNRETHGPGLIDFLRGDAKINDIIQQVDGSALNIITAGGRVSDEAVQLLSSQRMSQLIQSLRAKFDHIIIDTPPVLQLADAGILGSQSEEVLVVARMRRTPRPLVEQAINTLTSYNAQVNGIIATDNPRSRGRGYGYKYGYRYGYGYAYGYGYTSDRKGRKRKNRSAA